MSCRLLLTLSIKVTALGCPPSSAVFCFFSAGLPHLHSPPLKSHPPLLISAVNQRDTFRQAQRKWDESGEGGVGWGCVNLHTHTGRVSEQGCCVACVLCDLQKRGSYFHHATTSPHWPCNGALPSLDWLPRLKTPLICCCPHRCRRVWKSSLAQHAPVRWVCECLHAYYCRYSKCSTFYGGHKEPDTHKSMQLPYVSWWKLQQVY